MQEVFMKTTLTSPHLPDYNAIRKFSKVIGLSIPEQFFLLSLRDQMPEKNELFKSQSFLAEELGCSVSTVHRISKNLKIKGIITINKKRASRGRGNKPTNLYRFNLDIFNNTLGNAISQPEHIINDRKLNVTSQTDDLLVKNGIINSATSSISTADNLTKETQSKSALIDEELPTGFPEMSMAEFEKLYEGSGIKPQNLAAPPLGRKIRVDLSKIVEPFKNRHDVRPSLPQWAQIQIEEYIDKVKRNHWDTSVEMRMGMRFLLAKMARSGAGKYFGLQLKSPAQIQADELAEKRRRHMAEQEALKEAEIKTIERKKLQFKLNEARQLFKQLCTEDQQDFGMELDVFESESEREGYLIYLIPKMKAALAEIHPALLEAT
jgi:hypothetical protein